MTKELSTNTSSPLRAEEVNDFVVSIYPETQNYLCENITENYVEIRWKFTEKGLRPGGFISGPTLFTVADVALWYLSFTVVGLQAMAVTSNLTIDFLRPAVGGDVMARAYLLASGKRKISGRVDMWIDNQPEKIVAHATGSYMVR